MTVTEVTPKRGKAADVPGAFRSPEPAPLREARAPAKRRMQIIPFLITLATVTLAALLGWAMWGVYMGAPWTRDATVRAYIVTMAPEVAGHIVELPVADNKYVRRGDLLMVIDPTNYSIAVSQAEAAVSQVPRRRRSQNGTPSRHGPGHDTRQTALKS
jgi:multidrug resistance efflux pump